MTIKDILLGYETGTGKEVYIQPSHMVVTGVSQESGKTTTLESLIKRSKKKAIVFRTKIGEKSFLEGTIIPPFFRDRSDWKFIKGIVESTMKMRIDKFEQATIIQLCKETGGNSLLDFKKKVDQKLQEKISASAKVTLTNLQAYLEEVVPKLMTITFSNTLDLVDGLNIVDLERFSRDSEVQGLIIASVLDEILYKFKDCIVLIPEAWKFVPQDRGSPTKLALEEFIRQGATNRNYIWIDSQDMSGVDKTPLKQISTWILGYQSEKNEVKHTLEQIPLPSSQKPKPDQIMSLGKGVFYKATREQTVKVYVLPFWLDEERGKKIALGKLQISELDGPKQSLSAHRKIQPSVKADILENNNFASKDDVRKIQGDINELRKDFFDKIQDLQEQIVNTNVKVNERPAEAPAINDEEIVGRVLQKIKLPVASSNGPVNIDTDVIIQEVLKRVPAGGVTTYEVAPLEKLKRDILEETKQKLLSEIQTLSNEEKKILKYVEAAQKGVTYSELTEKCLLKAIGGNSMQKTREMCKSLAAKNLVRLDTGHGKVVANLKDEIKRFVFDASEAEVQQTYDHVIMEILQ
jgi:hypothetical protein